MMPKYLLFSLLFASLLLISCGTSTGSRYSSNEAKEEKTESKEVKAESKETASEESLPPPVPTERFELGSYRGTVEIDEPTVAVTPPAQLDVWYDYAEEDTSALPTLSVEKVAGFRVHVSTTDDLDEANNARSDILFRANQKNIYVTFDPPFYKVKVGDFLKQSEANDLQFKLKQIGYPEARVISDTVNVYK